MDAAAATSLLPDDLLRKQLLPDELPAGLPADLRSVPDGLLPAGRLPAPDLPSPLLL